MLDLQNAEIFRAALESLQSGVCIVDRDRQDQIFGMTARRELPAICARKSWDAFVAISF